MEKTNYSVARVVTYTKQSIGKAERHNERKNQSYSNMNVDLEQTKNNIYYKTCDKTYNERLKELIDENKVSLRGLKDNAKIFDELVLDINSDYFEKHGGYDFAKMFSNFSINYTNEQKDLKEKIEILNTSVSTTEQKEIAITSFVDKVKKYTEIKELTPEIINELIDKILVHQQTKIDGKKYQQIDIYYSGVGIISVSANEYDFEIEFQKTLKNKRKTA